MRGEPGAPLRRVQSELRAHRPRQPRIGRGVPRPRAFVQPAEHDEVEIQQSRFQRAEDREPLLAVVGRAHGARLGQLEEQLRILTAVGQRDPVAVADDLADQIGRGFSGLAAPERGRSFLGMRCGESLRGLRVRADEIG